MAKKDKVLEHKKNLKPYRFKPELIQKLLDEKLMNVATLAGIIGMNHAGMAKILRGECIPMADKVGKIAAVLEVKPGYFFDRD